MAAQATEHPVESESRAAGRVIAAVSALLLLAVSGATWVTSLQHTNPNRMNDYGLASVLPVLFPVALLVLSVAFALTLVTAGDGRRYGRALLALEITLLGLILYGTPAAVEVVPRSGTMWQHLGVADYIMRHGSVDKTIDAYFNWPGFFIALAFLQRMTGLESLAGLGAWAPVFFNLLDSLVLWNLVRLVARAERAAWLAVWLFLCTNWIGQDILSPQAFGYFVYLNIVLLAVIAAPVVRRRLLPWLRPSPAREDTRGAAEPVDPPVALSSGGTGASIRLRSLSPTQRTLIVLTIAVLFGAVAISHQLSPYAITMVFAALVLLNVTSLRAMPLLMTLIIFVWFTYSAVPFLQQFLHHETGSIGEVRQNVSASVAAHVAGTRGHRLIVYIRLALTGFLWAVALVSAVVRFRRGARDLVFYAIGLAPFVLVGLQSYGGEIALRTYLFTLPATVFFVAADVVPPLRTRDAMTTAVVVVALSAVLLPLFVLARYGNERLDYFTRSEYQAVQELYRISPPGSEFFVLAPNLPWRWQRYGADGTFSLSEYVRIYADKLRSTPETVANTMADAQRPTFLIFTPAQTTFATYLGGLSPTTASRFEGLIARSPRFKRVYQNGASVIYRAKPRHRS